MARYEDEMITSSIKIADSEKDTPKKKTIINAAPRYADETINISTQTTTVMILEESPLYDVDKADANDSTEENELTFEELENATYEEYKVRETEVTSRMGQAIPRYTFVHGLPFQMTPITDRRINRTTSTDSYGRVFAKEIVANTPISVITPCIPKFLTSANGGISNPDRDKILAVLQSGSDTASVDDILSKFNNKSDSALDLFVAQPSTASYYEYVNALCSASAINMGIGNMKYNGKKIKDLDWGKFNQDIDKYALMGDIVGPQINSVSIAYDPTGSLSDSLSNSTRQSSLAQLLKDKASSVQELEFMMGSIRGVGLNSTYDEYLEQDILSYKDMINSNPNSVIGSVSRGIRTIVSGSSIRMPEIWSDSNKSSDGYTITAKFMSPYADAFSKWRWVAVPFWHCFALTAPRSTTPTSFSSPYIIKAYSKGYYNCENGMIQSMSYRKFGDGDMITDDGIPTCIEVELSIRDLYGSIAMSNFIDPGNFFANKGLLELIGSMSGTNMLRLTIEESIAMYANAQIERFLGAPGRAMERLAQSLRNTYLSLTGYN